MEQMFIVGIGAMMVIGFVGIALGIMMLRNGFRPRTTPILLMSFIPFMFAVTSVTSLGSAMLPLMWGWAIAAHAVVARKEATAETVVVSTDQFSAERSSAPQRFVGADASRKRLQAGAHQPAAVHAPG
jgi:hypothetical protein